MDDMNIAEFEKFLAELDANIDKLRTAAEREGNADAAHEATRMSRQRGVAVQRFFEKLTAWDNVLLARHAERRSSAAWPGSGADRFSRSASRRDAT